MGNYHIFANNGREFSIGNAYEAADVAVDWLKEGLCPEAYAAHKPEDGPVRTIQVPVEKSKKRMQNTLATAMRKLQDQNLSNTLHRG